MLSGFDEIRAEAIEDGRPGLLDSIYVTGSSLIDEDTSLIKTYQRRHITVERMETSVLSVRVDRVSAKRVRLAVVDRLARISVRLPDGSTRRLPLDRPAAHSIELTLTEHGWRITSIQRPEQH